MRKPSKKQRNQIYVEALFLLKKDGVVQNNIFDGHTGICDYIEIVQDESDDFETIFEAKKFIEFANHKPKAINDFTGAWWSFDKYGFNKRVKVLLNCIELTN